MATESPIVSAGWIALVAGIVDLIVGIYITAARPIDADPSLLLAGLIAFYGLFFIALGITEILDLDLRVVGNLAIPTAILPLAWLKFFSGSTTFTPDYMCSRSQNTPFVNQTLQGSIDLVVKDGTILLER